MSCGTCKKKTKLPDGTTKSNFFGTIIGKSIMFILSMVILPFVYPFAVFILFKHFFIGQVTINPQKTTENIAKLLKNGEKKDKSEDLGAQEFKSEEYEIVGLEK